MTVEAAMIWNEPNNKSHWDPGVDPDWSKFGELVTLSGRAIKAANPRLPRVLGGMSPIDPSFVNRLAGYGAMDEIDVVAVHGFPLDWKATTRHKEAEGSSYYRHFAMGLLDQDGRPKLALDAFRPHAGPQGLGLCQWFHYEDHRLDEAVRWMKDLGVTYLRTGLSWADFYRPGALDWFDRQMEALAPFDVTVTFCFTPEHKGIEPHHTSAPKEPREFADFCTQMIERYAPARTEVRAPLLERA